METRIDVACDQAKCLYLGSAAACSSHLQDAAEYETGNQKQGVVRIQLFVVVKDYGIM